MGLFDKFKCIVNPDSIDENYDDEYVFDGEDENNENQYQYDDEYQKTKQMNPQQVNQQAQHFGGQPNQQYNQPQYNQPQGGQTMNNNMQPGAMSLNSSNIELKVVRPERFDAVKQVADHLLNHRTVVLNLEAANKETARRMLDFLGGVAYSIDGNLRKVANSTFVITPQNVDVSADQQQQAEQQAQGGGFDPYNGSL